MYTNNQEFECTRQSETLTTYADDSRINVKLGRALKKGEFRVKVYQLLLGVLDVYPAASTPCEASDVNVLSDDVIDKNVIAYLAGYCLRRVNVICRECKSLLIYNEIPNNSDLYLYLKNKAYREQGTLVYPKESVIDLFCDIEECYSDRFLSLVYSTHLLSRLFIAVTSCVKLGGTCVTRECLLKLETAVKVYLRVRMFSSLKKLLENAKEKQVNKRTMKRNRKLLKLQNM